jgi:hypothetical protein
MDTLTLPQRNLPTTEIKSKLAIETLHRSEQSLLTRQESRLSLMAQCFSMEQIKDHFWRDLATRNTKVGSNKGGMLM